MNLKPFLFFLLLEFLSLSIFSQNHDYIWLGGISNNARPPLSDFRLDFNHDPPLLTDDPKSMDFYGTCSVFSDDEGKLLFYSNGKWIASHNHQTMEDGKWLSSDDWASSVGDQFITPPQGTVVVPWPEHPGKYFLFYAPFKLYYNPLRAYSHALRYALVDMNENNGLGKVIEKEQSIVNDSLWKLKLIAAQHGNGRDWWILSRQYKTNTFYKILVSPEGISVADTMSIGTLAPDGLGQSAFSPDGTKYTVVNGYKTDTTFLQIFDFDRCNGDLSNETIIEFNSLIYSPGVSISPNSRFLYVSISDTLIQYDLWETDIPSSKTVVATYDGFEDPFATRFFVGQLAPNGKIYFSTTNGTPYFHVINEPDKKGLACDVVQHGIHLGSYNGTGIPNNPNYRLGPLDGSLCDTLGLDNFPKAKFIHTSEPDEKLKIRFKDLSYYEPESWFWEFGDNSTSLDTNPVHFYQEEGIYNVCLTVTNVKGTNTYCDTLNLKTTSLAETTINHSFIKTYPNPTDEILTIELKNTNHPNLKIQVYNVLGTPILSKEFKSYQEKYELNLKALPSGNYFFRITTEDKMTFSGKFVKE